MEITLHALLESWTKSFTSPSFLVFANSIKTNFLFNHKQNVFVRKNHNQFNFLIEITKVPFFCLTHFLKKNHKINLYKTC
ncbi:hypothetical protein C8D91_0789 [Marinicella litoralis]|uniref:Uncharacterized protein n=1 Tax=Marinicella litoralis TaxID=644220 RepID=A0A4V3DIJ2_9GAMM|nr:hypothetical protein C8D91_0789 [Marinicella litoralis]